MPSPLLLAKLARHRLRRAAASTRHGAALQRSPILFANAFPKSGTHLLTQILKACSRIGPAVDSGLPAVVMFEGKSGAQRPTQRILDDLHRLGPGDVAYGHLHALPPITDFFERRNASVFFLYRDPRDVAVSHVHYITEIETGHVHHDHYKALPDFDARLRTSILGRPEFGELFPDIYARFEPFLGWMDAPGTLALRFEDLIGNQTSQIERILDHLETFNFGFTTGRAEAIDTLSAAVNPARSPTFRSGKTGGWRERFTDAHKALFKDIAGELLIELGYEKNLDW